MLSRCVVLCVLIFEHGEVKLVFSLQTVSDIERGWILANKDQHRQAKSLQEKGSKKEVRADCSRSDL